MGVLGYLKSSILSKVVMAVTGAMLVSYIVIHTAGNMLIYLGPDAINSYSQFLHSLGPLLWIVRIILIVAAILHVWTSIVLKLSNLDAKPDKYAVKKYINAKLTSRTMLWTGIAIFLFVVYHVAHLTLGVTNPSHVSKELYFPHNLMMSSAIVNDLHFFRTDVYAMVILGFKNPLISICYMIAVTIVGFHLNHAIQSMFQTLGLNNKKYFPAIQKASTILSIVITVALVSIPITVLLGLIGGKL
jgi:succinate dehydrogenase / fumarate reductase cytochrome b subunit